MGNFRTVGFLSCVAAVITLLTAGYSLCELSVYQPAVSARSLPGAVGQDIASIAVSIAILFLVYAANGGKAVFWLPTAGLLSFLFYCYALYTFDGVYTLLFPGYLTILGLSAYSILLLLMKTPFFRVYVKPSAKPPPRKGAAVLFLLLAVLFFSLWSTILVPAMLSGVSPEGNAIFVLDLSFFIPLLVTEAVLLLRRKPAADLIAVPLLMKMGVLGFSVLFGVFMRPLFRGIIDPSEVMIYSLLGFAPLAFLPVYLRRIGIERGDNHENNRNSGKSTQGQYLP